MSYLPKLSVGIQRFASGVCTILDKGAIAVQAHSTSASLLPNQSSYDLGSVRQTPLRRGITSLDLQLPIYGKYCGPGHGDKSHCSPDDPVDAVCCQHDRCYNEGYFDCGCDCDLVRSMPSAIANTSTVAGKAAGAAAMAFFANSPCIDYVEVCLPVLGCHSVPIPFPGGPEKCLLF